MKDYFSHDYNSRNDKKLVNAAMKFDLCTSIGAYWCIVEMLYEEGGYLLLNEYERIVFELRTSKELITFLIYESELFKNDGERFWSETAIERLKLRACKSQKAKESIEKRWNKLKNTNVLHTNNDSNTSKVNKSKVNSSNIPEIPLEFPVKIEKEEVFITKKKRELKGKRLETFKIFWEKFNYKKGKAEAADSWLDIPQLTDKICEKIYKAAELESKQRVDVELKGLTPKMAQGWLSGRRYEDESLHSKEKPKNIENKW